MTAPVAFIIGSGSNVGQAVGAMLKGLGYNVALGSRNATTARDGFLPIAIDVTNPSSVSAGFDKVTNELGPASVVVFNPGSFESLPKQGDPLSLPREAFEKHIGVGTAVFDAAQHAVAGFRKLGPSAAGSPRTFIVTGNVAPWWEPRPGYLTIQSQKVVSKYLTELFSGSYKKEGFQFYFALQVNAKGQPPGNEFDGRPHAIAYKRILEQTAQGDYDVWFTGDGSFYDKSKRSPS